MGKFGPKNQNCQFKLKFRFWLEIPFLGKLGQKIQNCQFILKFGSYNNLGHNILEFYNVLVQISLTKSKTKRDN